VVSEDIGLRVALEGRREAAAGLKDIKSDVTEVGDAGEQAGKRGVAGLRRFAKGALVAGGVIAAGALAAGKALYKIGDTFDGITDSIRVGTGATGKQLGALTDSAKRVGRQVPVEFEKIGPAIADINTRLGLTGRPLEKLTKQLLEAGRITGKALDINKVTAAFSAYDIKGRQTSKTLDMFFRVSQATGVGMNELAASVGKNAPAMRQFGFSIDDSANLLGNLDKAGLDGNKTMSTLSRAMVGFAKEGRKPKQALFDTIGQIERFTKAGDQAGAINVAAKVFGTRGAAQFVAAVKAGKIGLDQFKKTAGGDTILKAGRDTADLAEKWQLFKNRGLLAVEPLAARVFNALGNGMDVINARVVPAVSGFIGQMKSGQGAGGQFAAGLDKAANAGKKVATFLDDNREVLVAVGAGFIAAKTAVVAFGVAAKVQAAYAAIMTLGLGGMTAAEAAATGATWSLNTALRANPIGLVVTAVALLVGAFVLAYKKVDWFRNSVNWLWNTALKPLAGFLMGGLRVALKGAGVVFRWLYENGIKPVGRFIRDRLVPWLMTLASGWLRMARFGLRAFRWLLTGAFKTFDGILSAAEKGLGWVPKLGPKIRGARAAFDKFGDGVIGKLKGVEGKLDSAQRKIDQLAKPRQAQIDIVTIYTTRRTSKEDQGGAPRAKGGPVTAGRPYIVGEHRPELFVPNVSGTILPRVPEPADFSDALDMSIGPDAGGGMTVQVVLPDGTVLAETVADAWDDTEARV
jgi:phage-related minor tail protein